MRRSTAGDEEKTTANKEKEDIVEPLFQDQLVSKNEAKNGLERGLILRVNMPVNRKEGFRKKWS